MTKLYLITGFLGAGKTTFLHQFVRLFPDRRTAIVVNEFGKQGVTAIAVDCRSGKGLNAFAPTVRRMLADKSRRTLKRAWRASRFV